MSLPKIQYPTYLLTLPSTGEQLKYRPFTVAEEKILLMASQAGDSQSTSEAIHDVLNACFLGAIDVRTLPSFDIEYLFLNVRGKSVSEIIDIEYRNNTCPKENGDPCKKTFFVRVKVDEIKVQKFDPQTEKYVALETKRSSKSGTNIKLDDELGITIKYPTMSIISETLENSKTDYEQLVNLVTACITAVFDAENVYTDFSKEELTDWFGTLTTKQKEPIQEFIRNLPMLRFEYLYKCRECGYEEKIEIEGLQNFL